MGSILFKFIDLICNVCLNCPGGSGATTEKLLQPFYQTQQTCQRRQAFNYSGQMKNNLDLSDLDSTYADLA